MSVPNSNRFQVTTLAADATNPAIGYNFKIDNQAELGVTLLRANSETLLVYGTNYTLTDIGNAVGGSINLIGDYLDGDIFYAYLQTPELQSKSWLYQDSFGRTKNESAFDYITNLCKRVLNETARTIRFPVSDLGNDMSIETVKGARALKFLMFDENGLPVVGDADGFSFATIGNAVSQSVAVAATPKIVDITLQDDTVALLTVFLDIQARGYQRVKQWMLQNIGGTLTLEAGLDDIYDANAVSGSESVDASCVVAGTIFDVNVAGAGLTATRTVNARWKLESFDNNGNITFA